MIHRQRLIQLAQRLLRFDSVNPPGNELAVALYIEKEMRALDLDVKTYSFAKNRPNVIATLKGTLPRRAASSKSLLITPHIDTVPFGSGWKFDPIGGTIHRGRIYGRGASDDKGNAAVGMEVMRSLVEDGIRLKYDVIFAATVDEETGSHFGIRPLLDKRILRPYVALITDSEAFDCIVAQKGLFHCRVQIFGKKAHGAYNWRGVNAIEIASRVIGRLKKHQFKFKKHALLVPPTKNIGTIRGGDKVNMVADFCEFSLDIRFMPGMTAQEVLKEVKKIIALETGRFKVIVDDQQKPYQIDPSHPLVRTYVNVCQKMGIKAALKGSQGATVITFFQAYGIPAFSTGWGAHGVIHANDEYAKIDTLYRGARVLEAYLKEYDNR